MTTIDIPTLINWLASGLIGFLFGVASVWVTYRYQRKRDDIKWEREMLKFEKRFEQETLLLERQFQQRLKELEQLHSQQEETRIREDIMKGIDDPMSAMRKMRVEYDDSEGPARNSVSLSAGRPEWSYFKWHMQQPKENRPDKSFTWSEMYLLLFGLPLFLSLLFGANSSVILFDGIANEYLGQTVLGTLGLLASLLYLIFHLLQSRIILIEIKKQRLQGK